MAKAPPKELLEQRAVLAEEIHVDHPMTTDKPMGPPPAKYTKALHERICEELRNGQRPQGACARAGITLATFHEWVRRGRNGDPWLYEFAQDVEIAYNTAEAVAVDTVVEAFTTKDPELRDPDAAKWFLERARPDGYSKQVKTAVESQIKEFMLRLEAALDPKVFEQVLAVYLGQSPAAQFGEKEVAILPQHGSTEENGSTE